MKKIIIAFALLGCIGSVIGFKLYHKPHQNMVSAKADVSLSSADLFEAFKTDETAANAKYLDKVITVVGAVREVAEENGVLNVVLDSDDLMFGVRCQLDGLSEHRRKDFPLGEKISLKGKCSGSLMDVVMVRCVEI